MAEGTVRFFRVERSVIENFCYPPCQPAGFKMGDHSQRHVNSDDPPCAGTATAAEVKKAVGEEILPTPLLKAHKCFVVDCCRVPLKQPRL
ncbi:hypothetical protein D3C86_1907560 [compost metagenome]